MIEEKELSEETEILEEKELSGEKEENMVEINEEYFPDIENDEDFELIDDPNKQENEILEHAETELQKDQNGGGKNDVKKVVVSFF